MHLFTESLRISLKSRAKLIFGINLKKYIFNEHNLLLQADL